MKVGEYKIPFKRAQSYGRASMMEYVTCKEGEVAAPDKYGDMPTEWRDNVPFRATLQLTGHYRGVAPGGHITGQWVFRKQGANYGLYPAADET